jgi:hypothetical protein
MLLVRTAGKRPKSHLSLRKADLSTAQSAFQSTGLRKENSNLFVLKGSPDRRFPSTQFLLVVSSFCKNSRCVSFCFRAEMLLNDRALASTKVSILPSSNSQPSCGAITCELRSSKARLTFYQGWGCRTDWWTSLWRKVLYSKIAKLQGVEEQQSGSVPSVMGRNAQSMRTDRSDARSTKSSLTNVRCRPWRMIFVLPVGIQAVRASEARSVGWCLSTVTGGKIGK